MADARSKSAHLLSVFSAKAAFFHVIADDQLNVLTTFATTRRKEGAPRAHASGAQHATHLIF